MVRFCDLRLRPFYSIGLRILAVSLLASGVCGQVEDALRRGDEAYSKCNVAAAVEAYRAGKRVDATNYEATWKLARTVVDQALLLKRSPEQKYLFLEAQSLAQEAIRLDPNDAKGYLYLAVVKGKIALFEGGKKKIELGKDVKTLAERAIVLNPNEDIAYHVLGIWHREMSTLNPFLRKFAELIYGKFPPASLEDSGANLKKAIELNGGAIGHHTELGLTYIELKRWVPARDEFEKALNLSKQYPGDDNYRSEAVNGLQKSKQHGQVRQ